MIYLISHTSSSRKEVRNLRVCQIEFLKFSLDLGNFKALVLTSKNSVKALEFNEILPKNLEVFSIGSGTSDAARNFGFSEVYTAKNAHGEEFAKEIAPLLKGKKTLFLKALKTVSNVGEILRSKAVSLTEIVAYENKFLKLNVSQKPPINSTLIFTSPSNVLAFLENFSLDESYRVVAIGKATAKELKFHPNLIVSEFQNIDKCIDLALNLK